MGDRSVDDLGKVEHRGPEVRQQLEERRGQLAGAAAHVAHRLGALPVEGCRQTEGVHAPTGGHGLIARRSMRTQPRVAA